MKRLSTIIAALLCSLYAHSQQVKYITSVERLSNSLINQIYQDAAGYVWVATEDGLNRFDGVDMAIYRSSDAPGCLKSNYVHALYEDSHERLWIGCITGLQMYNREYDSFVNVPMIIYGDTVGAHVTDIAEDAKGNIWIATSGRGLLRYNGESAVSCEHFVGVTSVDFVSSIVADSKGYLWVVGFGSGICRCNIDTREVKQIAVEGGVVLSDNAFVMECNGKIFLSSDNNGLYCYNADAERFERCKGSEAMTQGRYVVSALNAMGDNILVGTDGNGMFVYDMQSGESRRVELSMSQFDFNKSKIHSIFYDRDGNMWLSVFQKGIVIVPRDQSMFHTYGYHPNGRFNIGSGCVMSLLSDGDGLWVGADSDGLYYVSPTGDTRHVRNGVPATIMSMVAKGDRQLWLAAYNEGLVLFDKGSGSVTDCNAMLSRAQTGFNKRTTSLAYDNRGRLWVGTYGCGLFMVDGSEVKSHVSTSERIDYSRNEPINNWINAICSRGADMWFATYRGVCCYNTQIDAFVVVDALLRKTVEGRVVYDIATDESDNLWFATDKGIVRYNAKQGVCKSYDRLCGLAADIACSVIVDDAGLVWVGTYGGLSCFNPISETFENFYYHNGLQGNEYSRCAVDKSAGGRLFFGGLNGVSAFNPSDVKPYAAPLNVCLTRFFVNGREVRKGDVSGNDPIVSAAVMAADTFTLSYAEKTFSFDLSTFNFVNPEKVSFEYRLEGFDDAWHATPNGVANISFTNLRPGSYTLEYRAQLNNVRSEARRVLIVITPLWWQTWWAALLYAAVIGVIALVLYQSARSRRLIKAELLRKENQRNIDEAKFQFFFNISHEIRTPLTLIINPIKELLTSDASPEAMKNYNLIYRNSMRILRLINQLLDIRKIDKGQMVMRYTNVNIENFVGNIMHTFDYLSEKKSIAIEMVNALSDSQVSVDVNNFDKVIYNLYSNAFKYTPEGGKITTTIMSDDDYVKIVVSDTGRGIPSDKLDRIFERFYQVDDANNAAFAGTGIGLHLSQSIVNLHGGTISAANRADGTTGAVFTVRIPRFHEQSAEPDAEANESTVSPIVEEAALCSPDAEAIKRRATTNKRVLLVDDEPEVSAYISDELSKQYKVSVCKNGREAYETLLKNKFDIVVSDVMMPEMDGMTLCRKIKNNLNINHIPVVLLTAKHSDEDRNKGLLTGADAYIAKPFDIELLRNTIASIIANRERVFSRYSSATNAAEAVKKVEIKSVDEALIEKVNAYIDANIADPSLNVEKLASHVGMSRVHMHRKLKELTNQSARDYIKNIRLRQAGILLGEKKLNISEVAYALGFTNLSHFSSSFKDFYGVSPKEYMNGRLKDL